MPRVDFFRKEGAEVRDITLSPAADYHAVGYLLMIAEAFTLHAPWMRERFMDYGELFRDRVSLAAMMSGPDIVQATRRRRVLCREMAAAMEDLDIIVSASQPGEAPRIDSVPKWANMEKPSLHHAVQRHRLSRRSASAPASAWRPAGRHAAGRQAVHRADTAARRACLRDGDAVAREASGDLMIRTAGWVAVDRDLPARLMSHEAGGTPAVRT